jgi:hypothetical protein
MATKYYLGSHASPLKGRAPKICKSMEIAGYVIALYRRGEDNFAVRYGLQVDDQLTYQQACTRLGASIMHALACEGKLDK